MTSRRIGQALGLLALGLVLLVVSSERAFAPAPATWTIDATFSLRTVENPGPHGPNGIAMISLEFGEAWAGVIVNERSNTLADGPHHSAPPPGLLGYVPVGTAPHSVDMAEVAVAAAANSGSKEGTASQIRAAQAQQKRLLAFTANFGSNDVSVVDLIEKKVVETLKVGRQPTSLDFDPNSNKLYVNNFGDNSVSVIEIKATGGSQVIATITGFREPIFVKISPDGKRGYVSSQRRGEGVAIFDTATNTIIGRIDLPNVELRRLALSPDGKRLYVAGRTDILGTGQIAVIDTESLQVLQKYRTESFPLEIAVTPNGKCLVITHSVPNKVSLMDVSDGQFLVAQDPTAREPQSVAIIENRAYVTNYRSDSITVFKFGEQCT